LTSSNGLGSFVIVSESSVNDRNRDLRLIATFLLAFLIFLPLHYHAFTSTAQLAKECTCVHGARTQLALQADSPIIAPTFLATVFAAHYVFAWAGDWSKPQNVRGPPSSASL
jgi:hypothetical protein